MTNEKSRTQLAVFARRDEEAEVRPCVGWRYSSEIPGRFARASRIWRRTALMRGA